MILEDIRRIEHAQHQLPILLAPGDRTAEQRALRKDLRLGDDLLGHHGGKRWMMLLEQRREAVEVGEGVVRPFEIY